MERHSWETGGRQQQLQFVLRVAEEFFGPGNRDRRVRVRVWMPPGNSAPLFEREITISRTYANGTRRTNGFPEMGAVPESFVFFEETEQPDVYDLWWQDDVAVVAARCGPWEQGRRTQYGRGRLSTIVDAPVPRPIRDIE